MTTTPELLHTDIEKIEENCPNCRNEHIIFDSSNGEMICTSLRNDHQRSIRFHWYRI